MVYSISFIMCYTVSRDSAGILNLKIYVCACALLIKSVLTFSRCPLIKRYTLYRISRSRARAGCVYNSCACSYSHGAVGN